MNTKKQTLIESINRQRKLMGLNEIMDVNTNIDAKGALSGNKLDLDIIPLEEMDPDDDDLPASYRMYNSDEWVKAQKDELGGDDDDDDRSDDERDFYRGEEPMSLDDRMDMEYPDPNEREWQANRYGRQDEVMDELGTPPGVSNKKLPPVIRPDQMMNEAELDEGFGDFIGGLKNVGQMAGKAVGGAAQKAGQAIGGAAQKAGQAIGGAAQKAGQAVGSAYKEGNIKSKVATTQKQIDSVFAGLQNFAKINDQNLAQLNDVKLKLLSNKPTNPADITKQKQLVDKVGVLIKKTAQANNLLRMGVSSFGKKMAENENMDEGFGDFIGGLKNVGQMAGKAVGGAAQKAGQAIGGAAQKAGQAIGSAYNVGALSNQVSNVEKTMNKTMGDIKNYLDKNAKVYNDIANLQTQITSLSPQLQKELGAQLKKLGNTATSLTNLKKVVNPTMRTTGAGVAGSTNMAQSGRTTP